MTDSEPHDPTLPELLERARNGDDAARDEIFQKCRNYVAVVARAQIGTWLQAKVDASDLVQQTLLEAHRGFPDFRGQTEKEWLAWLRRILSHNAVDFVRRYHTSEKRRAAREVPLDVNPLDQSRWQGFQPVAPGESPSELVLQREREIEIADALTKLSDDYQEVIVLRNLQRLSFNEVAERMGRSRPAAQMLWMRAIQKLQEVVRG